MRTGWLRFATFTRSSPITTPDWMAAAEPTLPPAAARPPSSHYLTRSRSREVSLDRLHSTAPDGEAGRRSATVQPSASSPRPLSPQPWQSPPPPQISSAAAPQVCSYHLRERSPGAGRKRSLSEAQEERTCVWRGVAIHNRSEVQTSAGYPSVGLRYKAMRHHHENRHRATTTTTASRPHAGGGGPSGPPDTSWLREDRGWLPLVEIDRPFKVTRANNNNYVWGGHHARSQLLAEVHAATPSQHPSHRSCPR